RRRAGVGTAGGVTAEPCPARPPRPCRARLGSGASRTSGNSTVGLERLALSENGIGTCVTNSATATAAISPRISPRTMPYSVTPFPLEVFRLRSEERRVGEEWRSVVSPDQL